MSNRKHKFSFSMKITMSHILKCMHILFTNNVLHGMRTWEIKQILSISVNTGEHEAITEIEYLFVIGYCDSMLIKHWKFTLKEIFSSFSFRLTKRNTSSPVTKRPVSWEMGTHGQTTVYRLAEGEVLLSLICKYCIEKKHHWYVTSVQLKTFYKVNEYNSPSSL